MPLLLTEADRREIKKLAELPYEQDFNDEELAVVAQWIKKFSPPSKGEQTGEYQTEPEDTVYSVAQKFGTSPGMLAKMNDIEVDTRIAPDHEIDPDDPGANKGMVLKVPQAYSSRNRLLAKALRWSRHYQQTRMRTYSALETLFKGAEIGAGRPIGQVINPYTIGRHGTNIADVANLCMELQLGLDFTQQAKQYDGLRPSNFQETDPEFQMRSGQSDQERKDVRDLEKRLKSSSQDQYIAKVVGARGYVKAPGEQTNSGGRRQSPLFNQTDDWRGAAEQVREKALKFLANVKKHVLGKFVQVYPDKYIDFLKKSVEHDQPYFYTSDSASPVSIGSLGRVMRPSDGKQSGADLYHDIKTHVEDAAQRVYSLETEDKHEVLDHVKDVMQELNASLTATVVEVYLEQIDDSCSPDDIREGFRSALSSDFLLVIGRKILQACGKDYKGLQSNRVETMIDDCEGEVDKIRFGAFRFTIMKGGHVGQVGSRWLHNNSDSSDSEQEESPVSENPEIVQIAFQANPASSVFSQEEFYDRNKLPEVAGSPDDRVVYIYEAPDITTGELVEFSANLSLEECVARGLDTDRIVHIDRYGRLETDNSDRVMFGLKAFASDPGYLPYYSWYSLARKYRKADVNVLGDALVSAVQSDSPEEAISRILPVRVTVGSGDLEEAARDLARKYYKNCPTGKRPGSFLTAEATLSDGKATLSDPAFVPIFFTAKGRPEIDTRDYSNFTQQKPWPSYAESDGRLDPDKPVKVSYSIDGKQKTDVIRAGDIYAHKLDSPNWNKKGISNGQVSSQVSDFRIETEPNPESNTDINLDQEEPERSDHVVFYTSPDVKMDEDSFQCDLCTVDTPIYHRNYSMGRWDSRLTINRGRKPSEQIKITYVDPKRGAQTAIIRRHELLDRSDELIGNESMLGKVKDLKIFPATREGEAAFYIVKNGKLETMRYRSMERAETALQRMIETRQRAESKQELDQELSESDIDALNTQLPDSVGESIDYGDKGVLDKLNTETKFFDPITQRKGGFDTVSSAQNEKAENTYRKIINGEMEMVDPAIRSRLWVNPENVVKNQPWLQYEEGEVQIVVPISSEFKEQIGEITILDDSDPRQFMDEKERFWRLPVSRDNNGFLSVEYPWVHRNSGSEMFSGEYADRGSPTVFNRPLKVPLKDDSEIKVTFERTVKSKNRRKKSRPTVIELQNGVDFKLDPEGDGVTAIRQFVWQGQARINGELIELRQGDVIHIEYPESIGPAVYSKLNMPFSSAIELARQTWGDFELSRKVYSSLKKDSGLKFELDVNGLGWVQTEKGKARAQSMVSELLQDGAAAQRFKEKHGDFTCGNPLKGGSRGNQDNPGIARTESCPNKAVHEKMPRVLIQTKRAKVVLRDRSDALARLRNDPKAAMSAMRGDEEDNDRLSTMVIEPQWDWVSGSSQIYRDESDEMEQYFPGEGGKIALQMAKEAEESKDDWVSDSAIGTGKSISGICHPCWMSKYQIIPASIIQSMWDDLSEISAISRSYLGDKTPDQIESLGSGYESGAKKGEDSKTVRIHLKNPNYTGAEGEKRGIAYVQDWTGRPGQFEFVREQVIPSFPLKDWISEWFDTRDAEMENTGTDSIDGNVVYRVVLNSKGADWRSLMKHISNEHTKMGLKGLSKFYDPEWAAEKGDDYAEILAKKNLGFKIEWRKSQGVLIIAFDSRVGPSKQINRIYKDVRDYSEGNYERRDRPGYYVSDTEVRVPEEEHKLDAPIDRSFGKGHEQIGGRIKNFSQITLPDGTPMVGVVQQQDANEVVIKFYEGGELGEAKRFSRDEIGQISNVDIKGVKLLIQEKLAEFYANYLSNTSFWWKIRAYLVGLEGMQNNQKIRLITRLKQWHSQFLEEYRNIVDPKDALIDAGMSDRNVPFFSQATQRLMSFVGNIYFWTQYLKRRYGNRSALDENDPTIIPLMQLVNPQVRERQSYYAALNDTNPLPPQYSLKKYHRSKLDQEDRANGHKRRYVESVSRNSVVITNVHDAKYLNGLVGIVEGTYDNHYVVVLNENRTVEDDKVLLLRDEFAYIYGDPNPPLTESKIEDNDRIEYQKVVQEEIEAEQSKDELINLISEFTSEHASWD